VATPILKAEPVSLVLPGPEGSSMTTLEPATFRRTTELLDTARRVMPGGVLGTFALPTGSEVVIERGEGSLVWDVDGNEYVDFIGGSGPMILGHGHPEVAEAVVAQVRRGTHYYLMTEAAIAFADRLVSAIPCAEQVKLTSSGSEAVFYALRLARAHTGREKVLRFAGSYHGHNDYAALGTSAGIPAAVADTVITAPFNDLAATAALVELHRDDLAAIIVEPLQRIVSPRDGFLAGLRQLATEIGAILIFDEMVTGFRIAWGGGQERYGVTADMATYGKVIGGGFPMACVAGPAEIMQLANPRAKGDRYVFFSGTLNANPTGASAGLATLDVLRRPGTYERLEALSERVRGGLRRIAETLPYPLQIVGEGALVGMVFAEGDPFDAATSARSDKARTVALEAELVRRGFLTNMASKLYIATSHTEEQMDALLEAMDDALPALA
jgi:glutamate-1-semialdehyde 2,1-aminomutase